MTLSTGDFADFFRAVYGYGPFPWQERLLRKVVETGKWPEVLDLPTGSGKTAAIDIAVFHLALEADSGGSRRAPVRIAFVVDRRLVVDDAFERARRLASALAHPSGSVSRRVAERLGIFASEPNHPLTVRRLRGGVPRENDWARTPSQPTVLCSTVDQVGSRLLFRGYGVSDSMKPVHAGLLGADCLILLDEAHLAEPFRQTLEWVQRYRGPEWREQKDASPSGVALLTATPGTDLEHTFTLNDEDRRHPVLRKRLEASKPVRLVVGSATGTTGGAETGKEIAARAQVIVAQVRSALQHFKSIENGTANPAIGVVVNRVPRARAVFELLGRELRDQIEQQTIADPVLMIGPARPLDRDSLAATLDAIRTRTGSEEETRTLEKALILVATQCIEAGVDIDLDAVISEAAPIDSLRQRFGRLNRAGRDVVPYGSVVAMKSDLAPRAEDWVYEDRVRTTWNALSDAATSTAGVPSVEFGIDSFAVPIEPNALAPKVDAPILLPAHVDLLSLTSPIPAPDPDLRLYLHGPKRQPDSVSVIWRADVDPEGESDATRRLLTLLPPRAAEAIELPVWAVQRWLVAGEKPIVPVADVATSDPVAEQVAPERSAPRAFRWKGDDDASRWAVPTEIRSGDTVVVPAGYGGIDAFGWNPQSNTPAVDIARKAAAPFTARRFVVRVAADLPGSQVSRETLADTLAAASSLRWRDIRDSLLELPLGDATLEDLRALDGAKRTVLPYLDVYGMDERRRPRGVVFVAPLGIRAGETDGEGQYTGSTEDDIAGSITGFCLSLEQHSLDVEEKARAFAENCGLSAERIADLRLAGYLHDAGKQDPRFQRWLYSGDPLGADPDRPETILAKSERRLPSSSRATSGLPPRWRHEALSVRIARYHARLPEACDPDLVLWLAGTHHGHGRPLFPHQDETECAPDVGPQSLAFDWKGRDWPSLFDALKARYGVWELARMEAILRLADHRASEERAAKDNA